MTAELLGPQHRTRVRPWQDDNARLVNQAGLFTRCPLGMTVEEWVEHNCDGDNVVTLLHLKIPDDDRLDCLGSI